MACGDIAVIAGFVRQVYLAFGDQHWVTGVLTLAVGRRSSVSRPRGRIASGRAGTSGDKLLTLRIFISDVSLAGRRLGH